MAEQAANFVTNAGILYGGHKLGKGIGRAIGEVYNYATGPPARKGAPISLERRLRKLENRRGEWHTHTKGFSETPVTTTGTVTPLASIAEGNTNNDRTGEIIYLQSIQARGILSETSDVSTAVRLIMFFDTQQAGVLPTVTQVLSTDDVHSLKSASSKGRFQIMWDQTVFLQPTIASGNAWQGVQYYKKFRGRRIYFKGSTAADADLSKGSPYLLLIQSDVLSSPKFSGDIRLRFTEV